MFAQHNDALYKVGPDGKEYYFPADEGGEMGTYGYREGEQTCPHNGNTTSAFYITDGSTVWRETGVMYMEIPEDNAELESTLEMWLEDEEHDEDDEDSIGSKVVWTDGAAVKGVAHDYGE